MSTAEMLAPGEVEADREVMDLPPNGAAKWLCSLYREYAGKYEDLFRRTVETNEKMVANYNRSHDGTMPWAREAGRVICLFDTLQSQVGKLVNMGQVLLDHPSLESETLLELKLRLDELQEHVRYSKVMLEELTGIMLKYGLLPTVRMQIEKTRSKSPI